MPHKQKEPPMNDSKAHEYEQGNMYVDVTLLGPPLKLTAGETMLMSTLLCMDASAFQESQSSDESYDGWFYASENFILKWFHYSRPKQTRLLSKLVSLGLIEIKRRGMPACRIVRIADKKLRNRMRKQWGAFPMPPCHQTRKQQ
jgi:hypothetical protein